MSETRGRGQQTTGQGHDSVIRCPRLCVDRRGGDLDGGGTCRRAPGKPGLQELCTIMVRPGPTDAQLGGVARVLADELGRHLARPGQARRFQHLAQRVPRSDALAGRLRRSHQGLHYRDHRFRKERIHDDGGYFGGGANTRSTARVCGGSFADCCSSRARKGSWWSSTSTAVAVVNNQAAYRHTAHSCMRAGANAPLACVDPTIGMARWDDHRAEHATL